MYFALHETKGRTIEELEDIFEQRNPVKASLKKRDAVVRDGGVKMADVIPT
ncbi:hypothetical protein EYZ11_006571 [Aspergillus tanneri]|uniref:Uncharacterized protein n=1 Tax=Aspergillus tanneri TaxID=1220188 RepID=A0A4S3JFJ2_9EURO|nr:hypothetical protein EYZ11_006571 [Aspergillus tanneri]